MGFFSFIFPKPAKKRAKRKLAKPKPKPKAVPETRVPREIIIRRPVTMAGYNKYYNAGKKKAAHGWRKSAKAKDRDIFWYHLPGKMIYLLHPDDMNFNPYIKSAVYKNVSG